MAVCEFCKGEMSEVDGCVKVPFKHKDGKLVDPIKFGEEEGTWAEHARSRCGDCACRVGHYHHSGCDVERCPICQGQAISCECEEEEDE